jgi:hypothetical protein
MVAPVLLKKKKKKSKNKTLQNDVAGVVEVECSCRVAGVVEALKNKRKNRNKKNLQNGSTRPRPFLNGSGSG